MKPLNPTQAVPARALIASLQQAMQYGAANMPRSYCAMWTFENGRMVSVCPIGALFIGAVGRDVAMAHAYGDRAGRDITSVKALLQRLYPILRCTSAGQALAGHLGHHARGLAGGRPDLWNVILACSDDLLMDTADIADAIGAVLTQRP